MASMAVVGLLLEFVQALSAFYQLKIDWQSPFKELLSAISTIAFHLEVLKPSCVGLDDATRTLVAKLMLPPVLCSLFYLVFLADRALRPTARRNHQNPGVTYDAFINTLGTVILALYISLSLVTLSPFICFDQPDGSLMSWEYEGVRCWTSREHTILVVVGSVFVALYPLGILVFVAVVISRYQTVLHSSSGYTRRFRFLFVRWRHDRWYYQLPRLVRNLLVAFISAALPYDSPGIQINLLTFVLAAALASQLVLWPWRHDAVNYIDAGVSIILILLLSVGASGLQGSISEAQSVVSTCIVVSVLMLGAAFAVHKSLPSKQSTFAFFLSHHKSGAGNTARLMKLLLQLSLAKESIFFDADDLQDLDLLFEAVKGSRCIVFLLSNDALTRPWVVGELVTAYQNGIPILPVILPGAFDLKENSDLLDMASESMLSTLGPYGIGQEDIFEAVYYTLEHAERTYCTSAVDAVNAILDRSDSRPRVKLELLLDPESDRSQRSPFKTPSTSGPQYLLLGECADMEATSALLYIRLGLQELVQTRITVSSSGTHSRIASSALALLQPGSASGLVVVPVITQGILESVTFATALVMVARLQQRGADRAPAVHPIVVQPDFSFPDDAWYEELASTGAPIANSTDALEAAVCACEGVAAETISAQEVADAFKFLFRRICLPVHIKNSSEKQIREQMNHLIDRIEETNQRNRNLKRGDTDPRGLFSLSGGSRAPSRGSGETSRTWNLSRKFGSRGASGAELSCKSDTQRPCRGAPVEAMLQDPTPVVAVDSDRSFSSAISFQPEETDAESASNPKRWTKAVNAVTFALRVSKGRGSSTNSCSYEMSEAEDEEAAPQLPSTATDAIDESTSLSQQLIR